MKIVVQDADGDEKGKNSRQNHTLMVFSVLQGFANSDPDPTVP